MLNMFYDNSLQNNHFGNLKTVICTFREFKEKGEKRIEKKSEKRIEKSRKKYNQTIAQGSFL
jgi:hypothetical protein